MLFGRIAHGERFDWLGVKCQEVVTGLSQAADGRETFDALVGTVPVVVMRPARAHGGAHRGVVVGDAVSPLAQRRLDKTLGLAVGLGAVRSGKDMFATQVPAGLGEVPVAEGRAVVGKQAAYAHAQSAEVGAGVL